MRSYSIEACEIPTYEQIDAYLLIFIPASVQQCGSGIKCFPGKSQSMSLSPSSAISKS